MARPLRIEYPGAYYHVTSRGNDRKAVFRDDRDRERFIELLASAVDQFTLRLHSYVLMANHYHFLVETPQGQLNRAVRYLNGVYTQSFNRRHRRVGHLFQGRYKAILIDTDSYLVELSRYIHLNPWRVRVNAQDPFGYRWSSLRAYTGRAGIPEWLTTAEVLGEFGQRLRAARRKYREFVREGMQRGVNAPWGRVQWQTVLGDEPFVEEIKERFLKHREMSVTELSGLRESRKRVDGERVLREVCSRYGLREEELGGRSHGLTEPRYVASYLLRRHCLMTLREIGDRVGLHYSSVGNAVRQVGSGRDKRWNDSLSRIEEKIKNP